MKISKKVREEAIRELLALSDCYLVDDNYRDGEIRSGGCAFALDAIWKATRFTLDVSTDCLEAAALLRDGWNPGDPVYLRGAK